MTIHALGVVFCMEKTVVLCGHRLFEFHSSVNRDIGYDLIVSDQGLLIDKHDGFLTLFEAEMYE